VVGRWVIGLGSKTRKITIKSVVGTTSQSKWSWDEIMKSKIGGKIQRENNQNFNHWIFRCKFSWESKVESKIGTKKMETKFLYKTKWNGFNLKMGSNPKIQIILILAITTWRGREYTKAIEIDNLREREGRKQSVR
jgi:hypothetical protein